MPSDVRGFGRTLGTIGGPDDLIGRLDSWPSDSSPDIVADWFFQPGPPPPLQIPYGWLSTPLRGRPDKPLTTAAVTGTSGAPAYAFDRDSMAEYGDSPFSATLATADRADLVNLAEFTLDYYATQPDEVPRWRFPSLVLNLSARTQPEQWRILSASLGRRITITGAPDTWPQGATEQVIEGIHHTLGEARVVEWNTAPVIGSTPGEAGPWFRLGVSALDGSDLLPF